LSFEKVIRKKVAAPIFGLVKHRKSNF